MTIDLGLYIHVPFCRSKCTYCDFNSYAGKLALRDEYMRALESEIDRYAGMLSRTTELSPFPLPPSPSFTTVYFGGGNPALLGGGLVRLLAKIRDKFRVAAAAEVSVELNPEDVELNLLFKLRAGGVNRLSVGWQSLDDGRLKALGRRHDARTAVRGLDVAREAGFDNVNVDMIFGLPGQGLDAWLEELRQVIDYRPDHVSAYALTVEPGTPLERAVARGEAVLPTEDETAGMYDRARELLARAGYVHYELSNFAKPGRECGHNLNYWLGGDYLGVGAGAHSHLAGRRWWSAADPAAYIEASATGDTVAGGERLDAAGRLAERIFMGLRLIEGVDCTGLRREFGVNVFERFGDQISRLEDQGLITVGPRLSLTEKGLLLANQAMCEFV